MERSQTADNDEGVPETTPKKTPTELALEICNSVSKHKLLGCVDQQFQEQLRGAYAPEVEKAYTFVLDHYEFSPDVAQKLRHVAVHYLTSSSNLDSRSGLVFAGFGENQIFPAVRTVSPHLISLNRLLYAEEPGQCHEVSFKSEAAVVPFAQSDVVETFLEGIKPIYKKLYESSMFDGFRWPSRLNFFETGRNRGTKTTCHR